MRLYDDDVDLLASVVFVPEPVSTPIEPVEIIVDQA